MDNNGIRLDKIAGGALQERFSAAFNEVMKNLVDVNTPFKDKRSINIRVDFRQNETRDDVQCEISVQTKLAPALTAKTEFGIFKDLKDGTITTEEYGSQMRGQTFLPEKADKVVAMKKQA